MPLGDHYLSISLDNQRQVLETNELNNIAPLGQFHIIGCDIVVDSITVDPDWLASRTLDVTWKVSNAGNAPTKAGWNDCVELWFPSGWSWSVVKIGCVPSVCALAPNDTAYTSHLRAGLPPSVGSGECRVIVKVDADNTIIESNELNTFRSDSVTVPPSGAVPKGWTLY